MSNASDSIGNGGEGFGAASAKQLVRGTVAAAVTELPGESVYAS